MKDLKIYLAFASFLLVFYIVTEYNKPKPVNWQPTLYYGDKIPFGTYIFYHQLENIFQDAHIVNTNKSAYSIFHGSDLQEGNYIILAKTIAFTKTDFKAIAKYIEAGNTVFISALEWKGYLADTLKLAVGTEYTQKNTELNFTATQLRQATNYKFDKDISTHYFSQFDTLRAAVIGKNSAGDSNFLSFKFGKGTLYVCANPEVFSNYSLLKPEGADYAAKALSYLPVKQNIYWDEYQNHDIEEDQSPMRVFFKYPNLQWAYYISLFSLLTFVLFEVKRQQRIIPVIEPLKNSSLDFVKVVGQVYYEKRDNSNIAYKKMLFLFSYLREKYYLKTNKLDNEFIDSLVMKTGITPIFARELVDHINYVGAQQHVNDHELLLLNQLIEKFYTQS